MELNTKNILILAGLAGVAFYLYKKKKNAEISKDETAAVTKTAKKPAAPTYPEGLKEGDYVKGGTEATVYVLKGGKKLPITYDWWIKYAADQWDNVKQLQQWQIMDIPVGETLTV